MYTYILSVQLLSCVQLFAFPYVRLPCPSPNSQSLLKLVSIKSVMPSMHLILRLPLLLLPSIFPNIRVFLMNQFFTSGGQRVSASASVLPVIIWCRFPLGLTSLISLLSKGLSIVFSNTTVKKHQFFGPQLSLWSNSHIHT